jgi:hypothetical protein
MEIPYFNATTNLSIDRAAILAETLSGQSLGISGITQNGANNSGKGEKNNKLIGALTSMRGAQERALATP